MSQYASPYYLIISRLWSNVSTLVSLYPSSSGIEASSPTRFSSTTKCLVFQVPTDS